MSRLDDVEVEAIRERHRHATTEGLVFGLSYVDVGMLLADRDVLVAELEALQAVLRTQREYWAASDAFDQAVKDEDYGSLMGVALRRFHVAKDAARGVFDDAHHTPNKCPRCGSDDPKLCNFVDFPGGSHEHRDDTGCCPDEFHRV